MSIDLVLMLSVAVTGGLLAHALRLPPMVGFLLAGFVLAGLGVSLDIRCLEAWLGSRTRLLYGTALGLPWITTPGTSNRGGGARSL